MYDKLTIYYFTGTGNALAVANWISEITARRNIDIEIIKITPSLLIHKKDFSENTLIGFCYPTHGFNAPPIVIDFLLRFPKMKNKVFVLNTRAGMKISKLFTPGISGLAQLRIFNPPVNNCLITQITNVFYRVSLPYLQAFSLRYLFACIIRYF